MESKTRLEIREKLRNVRKGELVTLINSSPRSSLFDFDYGECSFMGRACEVYDVEAINLLFQKSWTFNDNVNFIYEYMLEKWHLRVFILLGLDLRRDRRYANRVNWFPYHPITSILAVGFKCSKICIANGYRLKHVLPHYEVHRRTDLIIFEHGVIKCRDVIVVLLGLKKRRQVLGKLDRFLVQQELAVAIWSTRSKEMWQK